MAILVEKAMGAAKVTAEEAKVVEEAKNAANKAAVLRIVARGKAAREAKEAAEKATFAKAKVVEEHKDTEITAAVFKAAEEALTPTKVTAADEATTDTNKPVKLGAALPVSTAKPKAIGKVEVEEALRPALIPTPTRSDTGSKSDMYTNDSLYDDDDEDEGASDGEEQQQPSPIEIAAAVEVTAAAEKEAAKARAEKKTSAETNRKEEAISEAGQTEVRTMDRLTAICQKTGKIAVILCVLLVIVVNIMKEANFKLPAIATESIKTAITTYKPLGHPTEWMNSTIISEESGHPFQLAVRRWSPSPISDLKATVIIQHGGGWHTGYYDQLGISLSAAGYEMVAADSMGHGYSEGPLRSDTCQEGETGELLSDVTFWTSLKDVSADLSKLLAAEKEKGEAPVVIMAESTGSLIAIPLAVAQDPFVDAIIAIGGLFKMTKGMLRQENSRGIIGKISTDKEASAFDSVFGDSNWAKAAHLDPLIPTKPFYISPASDYSKAIKKLRKQASRVTQPLYVMHSKVDTHAEVKAAIDFYKRAKSVDKTVSLYDDASHLLFGDTKENTEKAIKDVIEWLDVRYTTN